MAARPPACPQGVTWTAAACSSPASSSARAALARCVPSSTRSWFPALTLTQFCLAQVQLARLLPAGELVALKVSRATLGPEPEHAARRSLREVQILADSQHACIVRFIGACMWNCGHLAIVMEYMEGAGGERERERERGLMRLYGHART